MHTDCSTRVAALLAAGIPYSNVRTVAWVRPSRGVARPATLSEHQPWTRICDAAALLSRQGALGGWASAWWQGLTTLDGSVHGVARDVLLHVGHSHQLRPRPGVDPSRLRLEPHERALVRGLWCSTLPRALYDEMRLADGLVEAVVVVDAGTSTLTRGPRTALSDLDLLVHGKHKTRGIVQARSALTLACQRSASPGETRLRVAAESDGIGPLLVNAPVFDPSSRLVGVVDLLDETSGLVLEYDGAGHREEQRHSTDNAREEALEDLNLVVVRAGAVDLRRPVDLARRIRAGRRRGLVRDHRADRWTVEPPPWWAGSRSAQRWGYPPWR